MPGMKEYERGYRDQNYKVKGGIPLRYVYCSMWEYYKLHCIVIVVYLCRYVTTFQLSI